MSTPVDHAATVRARQLLNFSRLAYPSTPEEWHGDQALVRGLAADVVALAERATELERAVEWRELIAEDWKRRATELERDLESTRATLLKARRNSEAIEEPAEQLEREREKWRDRAFIERRRAEQLETALRQVLARIQTRRTGIHMDGKSQYGQPILAEIDSIARAALDPAWWKL